MSKVAYHCQSPVSSKQRFYARFVYVQSVHEVWDQQLHKRGGADSEKKIRWPSRLSPIKRNVTNILTVHHSPLYQPIPCRADESQGSSGEQP